MVGWTEEEFDSLLMEALDKHSAGTLFEDVEEGEEEEEEGKAELFEEDTWVAPDEEPTKEAKDLEEVVGQMDRFMALRWAYGTREPAQKRKHKAGS